MSNVETYRPRVAELSKNGARRRQKAKPEPAKVAAAQAAPPVVPMDRQWIAWTIVALLIGAWAYKPTLIEIVGAWNREPDYSHGFLVVPVALFLLWVKRAACPGISRPDYWVGFGLIG